MKGINIIAKNYEFWFKLLIDQENKLILDKSYKTEDQILSVTKLFWTSA